MRCPTVCYIMLISYSPAHTYYRLVHPTIVTYQHHFIVINIAYIIIIIIIIISITIINSIVMIINRQVQIWEMPLRSTLQNCKIEEVLNNGTRMLYKMIMMMILYMMMMMMMMMMMLMMMMMMILYMILIYWVGHYQYDHVYRWMGCWMS